MFRLIPIKLFCLAALSVFSLLSADSRAEKICRDDGVIVQVLGAGGPEIDDGQGGPSYLVWIDGKARVLIDTGPGSSVAFDKAQAEFADLYAILFTHLHVDHTADFPSFIQGSYFNRPVETGLVRPGAGTSEAASDDEADTPNDDGDAGALEEGGDTSAVRGARQLIVLGPDSSNDQYPDTITFVERMIGPNGAYPYLSDFLTWRSSGGYRVRPRNVQATGNRKWARFGRDDVRISAVPVNHAAVPALAWRIDIGNGAESKAVVFTGDFNNEKNVLPDFAANADALIATHAIPENARGTQRDMYALPSQIGRIAKQADARMLILAHRMNRTKGRESQTRNEIEANYQGYILFANDGECWGL